MQNSTFIVLQAYGKDDFVLEALYLILSYLRLFKERASPVHSFLLYTDRPEAFSLLREYPHLFKIEPLQAKQIQEWKGKPPFVHRVKIKIMQDFFQKYSANLLYLDTDTYFVKSPEPLLEQLQGGAYLMHCREGLLSEDYNPLARKLRRFLERETFEVKGEKIRISPHLAVYNAGLVGIPYAHRHILEEVLFWTDTWYSRYPKHVMEQLAFSYVLGRGKLLESQAYIRHYWYLKEFRGVLREFFNRHAGMPLSELAEAAKTLLPESVKLAPSKGWKSVWRSLFRRGG